MCDFKGNLNKSRTKHGAAVLYGGYGYRPCVKVAEDKKYVEILMFSDWNSPINKVKLSH